MPRPPRIDVTDALYHGPDQASARQQYRAFVEACVLEDDAPLREATVARR